MYIVFIETINSLSLLTLNDDANIINSPLKVGFNQIKFARYVNGLNRGAIAQTRLHKTLSGKVPEVTQILTWARNPRCIWNQPSSEHAERENVSKYFISSPYENTNLIVEYKIHELSH
jgi:hypothetical protein